MSSANLRPAALAPARRRRTKAAVAARTAGMRSHHNGSVAHRSREVYQARRRSGAEREGVTATQRVFRTAVAAGTIAARPSPAAGLDCGLLALRRRLDAAARNVGEIEMTEGPALGSPDDYDEDSPIGRASKE